MSLLLLIPSVARTPDTWRATWDAALANVATAPATVLAIGDSVTEGQGASTKAQRWTDGLTTWFQTNYPSGATGGAGYLAPDTFTYASDSPWKTYSATSGTITLVTTVGDPGFRACQFAVNASRTWTVTGTSVDILWMRNTGAGSFTWAVDGGATTAVSTAGTRSVIQKTRVTFGSAGSHTVTVAATSAPVTILGLYVFNGDETKGVHLWEAGHTGWRSSDYIGNADYAAFVAFVTDVAPDLVLIQLGLNDYGGGTAGVAVTSSAYQTNMQTLCASLAALPKPPSILVIDTYDFPTQASNPEPQSAYRTVLLNLVQADLDHRSYLDLGTTMPPTDTAGTTYYRSDQIHPNDSGHAEILRQLKLAVVPWRQPDPQTATATVINDAYAQPVVTTLGSETWTGTTGASWPAQWTITNNSGAATIQANAGRLATTVATAYAIGPRAFLTGMTSSAPVDATMTLTWTTIVEQYTVIGIRTDGTVVSGQLNPTNGYSVTIYPNGGFTVARSVASVVTTISGATDPTYPFAAATAYKVRIQAIGAFIAVKIWPAASVQPDAWTWSTTDASPYLTAGKFYIQHSNGATGNLTLTVDDLVINDRAPLPDPVPGQVTGLTALPGDAKVTLSWDLLTAATAGYNIYRDGVSIGSVGTGVGTYSDLTAVNGSSYNYQVAALSSSGEGQPSAQASATPVSVPAVQWPTRLQTATSNPAVWLAIGDSITEGQGASVRTNRWTEKALAVFRSTAGVGGTGPNFYPTRYRVYASDSPWGATGITVSGTAPITDAGAFGYRGRTLGSGSSITWTVTGTAADIWYRRQTGGGSFLWRVDGGSATSVSAAGTDAWVRTTISLGASASHTVSVSQSVGSVIMGGLTVFDGDTAAGVHLYNAGSTSITSNEYVGTDLFETASPPEYALMKTAWTTIAPDLVTVLLGFNDPTAITASQTAANLTTIISDLQSLPKKPHIVLIAGYTPSGLTGSWASYVTAMQGVATARGVTFLNLSNLMPTATTAGTGFYSTDGLHPNDSGQTQISNFFVSSTGVGLTKTGGAAGRGASSGAKTVAGSSTTYTKTGGAGAPAAAVGAKSVVHVKTGGGAAGGVASGARVTSSAAVVTKTGSGAAPAAASGAKTVTSATVYTKTGSGAAVGTSSGARTTVHAKTGSAASPTAASGAKAVSTATTTSKTGAGAAPAVASGAKTLTSATTTSKTGSGAAVGASSGARTTVHAKTGAGVASAAASGAKTLTSAATVSKTGAGASPGAASGAKTVTSATTTAKAGAGASPGAASGAKAVVHDRTGGGAATGASSGGKTLTSATTTSKTGAGAASAAASGARATVHDKTGAGVAVAAASGAKSVMRVKTGAGATPGAASGAKAVVHDKTGAGAAAGAGVGNRNTIHDKTGGGAAAGGASGAKALSGAAVVVKTGAAAATAVAVGNRTSIHVKTGSGAGSGAAAGARALVHDRTGGAASAAAASGGRTMARDRTGGAAASAAASGGRVLVRDRTGAGVAAGVASGARVLVRDRIGAAAASAAASGAKTVAVAATVSKAGAGAAAGAAAGARALTHDKTGGAASTRAASGAKTVTAASVVSKTGGAAAVGGASGARTATLATTVDKTGGAAGIAAASGARLATHDRTGAGTASGVASGVRTVASAAVAVKTGGAARTHTASGARTVGSGATVDKAGGGVGIAAAAGGKVVGSAGTYVKTGGAVAATAASGAKTLTPATVTSKTGGAAAAAAGSGARTTSAATTSSKTGGAVAAAAAAGSKALSSIQPNVKTGGAAVGAAGSGARTVVHVKSGGGAASGAAVAGRVSNVAAKTGGGAASGAAVGARAVAAATGAVKGGGAVAAASARGAKTVTPASVSVKAGGGAGAAAASGARATSTATVRVKSGGAAPLTTADGAKALDVATGAVKSGGAVRTHAASGARTVTPAVVHVKTGGAAAAVASSGVRALTRDRTGGGAGTASAVGARVVAVATVHTKTGGAVCATAAVAAKALLRVRTGGAVCMHVVGGSRDTSEAVVHLKTGGAVVRCVAAAPILIAQAATRVHAGIPTVPGGMIRAETPVEPGRIRAGAPVGV